MGKKALLSKGYIHDSLEMTTLKKWRNRLVVTWVKRQGRGKRIEVCL